MLVHRTLSAWSTLFLKLIFGPLWVLGFGGGVLMMWIDPQGLVAAGGNEGRWEMTATFALGAAFFWWCGLSLKKVAITSDGLRISNYVVSQTVPFTDIAEVTQFTWAHPRVVTIRFTPPTRFGAAIRYLPRTWFTLPFEGEDHEVAELRKLSQRRSV